MADGDYWLVTERLGLRRFTPADFDWLTNLWADIEVARYLGGTKDRAGVEEMLNVRILRYYDERPGLGVWATVERGTGQRVGFHLLNDIQGETILQIGYGLIRPAWGKGYATEMAGPLLRYGFVDLQLPRIAGITHIENVASQRVLQKVGLQRHGERFFPHPAYAASGPMAFFEREAAAWLADHGTWHP